MRSALFATFCILTALISTSAMAQNSKLSAFLPAIPEGWAPDGEVAFYNSETLYDYIDGGAELYLSYGMDSVISLRILHPQQGEIRIEIFDLIESKNAFGVFTHTRTANEAEYGQSSQFFTGALIFWKGPYYVTIVADDDNETIRKAMREMASDIDSKILKTGAIPKLVEKLPAESLQKDGFIYFHHYIWMNAYYFISSDNLLNISSTTDVVMARYGEKENRYYLLLIEYETEAEALAAIQKFRKHYMEESSTGTEVQIEDGSWCAIRHESKVLAIVFNATSYSVAKQLLDKINYN